MSFGEHAMGLLTPRYPTAQPHPGHPLCLHGTRALVEAPTGLCLDSTASPLQIMHPFGFWSSALHFRAQSKVDKTGIISLSLIDIQHPLAGHRHFQKMYFYTLFYMSLESSLCSQQGSGNVPRSLSPRSWSPSPLPWLPMPSGARGRNRKEQSHSLLASHRPY